MADESPAQQISKARVLYTVAGMDDVTVQQFPYQSNGDTLTLDVYAPAGRSSAPLPVVILVTGYSDAGARKMLGCAFNEMGSFVSWARLIAASGIVAVTYVNHHPADVRSVIEYVRGYATALGIDANRLGLWSCSGHAPNALSLLMKENGVTPTCGVFCYPYTIDQDGATVIADASTQWGFFNACAGHTVSDLSTSTPIFIVRAGQDEMPGLNATLDLFVAAALAGNLPVTVVNHAAAPHAFDLFYDGSETRAIVEATLRWMQRHLAVPAAADQP